MTADYIYKTLINFFEDESVSFYDVLAHVENCCVGSISLFTFRKVTAMYAASVVKPFAVSFSPYQEDLASTFNLRRHQLLTSTFNYPTVHAGNIKKILNMCEMASCVRESTLRSSSKCRITGVRIGCSNGIKLQLENHIDDSDVIHIHKKFKDLFKSWFIVRHVEKQMISMMDWLMIPCANKQIRSFGVLYDLTDNTVVHRDYESFRNAWMYLRSYNIR